MSAYLCVLGVGLLTGSSNFRSREKNRMKSTAEVLVMVYLQGRDGGEKKTLQLKKQQKIQRKPRLSSSSKVSKPYRGLATDSQANGDEEEAPVGESDVQGGCQGWERQRGRLCLGSSIPGIRLSRLTGNRLTVRQDLKICRCDINGQFLRAFQRSHMRPTVTMETLHVCMKQAV